MCWIISASRTFAATGLTAGGAISIANLVTSLGGNWQLLGAAAFLSMALPLLVFALLQRYFVRGITGGAVKG